MRELFLLFFNYALYKLGVGIEADEYLIAYVKARFLTEYLTLANYITENTRSLKLFGNGRIDCYELAVVM